MLSVPAGYTIERLSGPEVVACLLHWGLFGTLSVQLYLYYLAFPKDRKFKKYLVYGIYIVQLVQTMLFTHGAFLTFGYGFGDLEAFTEIQFIWLIVPIIGAVRYFCIPNLRIVSRSRIVSAFIICISLTSFVAAIITGVGVFQSDDITALNDRKSFIFVGVIS
ncbi:hypothetical protein EDD18DRAFT_1355089 [Armillaria luteobubalina]|uniref:Uncharacterized protein n=1 Tax=Armillaria luteobubalina TaxID=153913 RepID=A0AA39UN50_9AGAR|nr:hypothetical protein EDD18DRAFT_1355089 [Armillaria luteobubalina]